VNITTADKNYVHISNGKFFCCRLSRTTLYNEWTAQQKMGWSCQYL